ncbi:MAG: AAA-like domain-containing protein, partial [Lachnospiraceae bacterium]|nr:AAA-like domain-containing protein [Lachnospiraceae bacterium]
FMRLSRMCKNSIRPIVLMIDEVDSASNNQVFVDFLAQLRGYYLKRDKMPIFHSVILAGVYSIKNLKLKLRPESEHQYNSPWNIAADFKINMSFSAEQIAAMLGEYEADNQTRMDIHTVAEEIYAYTSGYPVLVSTICKYIDEDLSGQENFESSQKAWTKDGVAEAVKNMLKKSTPLFESMVRQLDLYEELRTMLENIIYQGMKIPFSPDEKAVSMGLMFGFLTERNGQVAIANRIFEMYLLNLFMTEEAGKSEVYLKGDSDRIGFIKNGRLDMDLVLKKFVEYFHEISSEKEEYFIEKYGRKFFLLYLKPIINGTGNYYIEAQTRDARRTDVIVDYLGEQFIVELKIWHGSEYNERGEKQLLEYLEYYNKDKGYMLSFNFNQKKEIGVKEIQAGGKTIVEAVV